jgi:hypothetical protein
VNGTFIYIEKTNETFHLNEGTCTLGNVAQKPEFLKIFLDDFWSTHYPLDRTILGPSALLRLIKLLNNSRGPEAANLVICYFILFQVFLSFRFKFKNSYFINLFIFEFNLLIRSEIE